MNEYQVLARSNCFKVKDIAEFRQWADAGGYGVVTQLHDGEIHCVITDDDQLGWPRKCYDEDFDELDETSCDGDFCVVDESSFETGLAQHLQEDSVAVLSEVRSSGYLTFGGSATAINSKGEVERIDLNDIYEKASHLGRDITSASSLSMRQIRDARASRRL